MANNDPQIEALPHLQKTKNKPTHTMQIELMSHMDTAHPYTIFLQLFAV
jgi:hypothetical protein